MLSILWTVILILVAKLTSFWKVSEYDKRHRKKTEECSSQNVGSIVTHNVYNIRFFLTLNLLSFSFYLNQTHNTMQPIFYFSYYWTESVIFQLLMLKANGKDQFFLWNFTFVTWVMKFSDLPIFQNFPVLCIL